MKFNPGDTGTVLVRHRNMKVNYVENTHRYQDDGNRDEAERLTYELEVN